MFTIGILFGIVLGFPMGIQYLNFLERRENSRKRKEAEEIFVEFSKKKITFKQRIGNYMYFNIGENPMLFAVQEREAILFNPDNTILTSSTICKGKTTDMFINMIESTFETELNEKMMDFNGIKIRESLFRKMVPEEYAEYQEEEQDEPQLSLDGILEKIHEKGMKSLTEEEKEFLKRNSK